MTRAREMTFQGGVTEWMLECFGSAIMNDRRERTHWFLEEALELVRATGCTSTEAHQLVDYVFGRSIGEPAQEVGGVMVTLAALCEVNAIDMATAAAHELQRVWTKIEVIRIKHAAKPRHSPLPGSVDANVEASPCPPPFTAEEMAELRAMLAERAAKWRGMWDPEAAASHLMGEEGALPPSLSRAAPSEPNP